MAHILRVLLLVPIQFLFLSSVVYSQKLGDSTASVETLKQTLSKYKLSSYSVSEEEYNYMTKGYIVQIEQGLDMKQGYFIATEQKIDDTNYNFEFRYLMKKLPSNSYAFIGYIIKAKSVVWGNTYWFCIPNDYNQIDNSFKSITVDYNMTKSFFKCFAKLKFLEIN